jgi:hypothetical protein
MDPVSTGVESHCYYPVGYLLIWQPCFMWQCSKLKRAQTHAPPTPFPTLTNWS